MYDVTKTSVTPPFDAIRRASVESLDNEDLTPVHEHFQAANYLAAAMTFLRDNPRLDRDLTKDDIKHRLLGHWGTCPLLNLVYSHTCRLARKYSDFSFFTVTGSGHGAPSTLANYYIEGTLGHFYPHYTHSPLGFHNIVTQFSVPGGFPSHINAQLPSIHEGGELGYALGVAYGAVMDNPEVICVCEVGDGEAETGPTATMWHAHKFIDYKESGIVLPIVNVNGFKIANRTIFGCMSDEELLRLFEGYGYQPVIVSSEGLQIEQVHELLAQKMDWAMNEINHIVSCARNGKPLTRPRPPVLILRTPKGWTGVRGAKGYLIEGSWRSHQVPLPNAKTDGEELHKLGIWLKSYKPHELFNESGVPNDTILANLPPREKVIGMNKIQYNMYKPLKVPSWEPYGLDVLSTSVSATMELGKYLAQVISQNAFAFRIFSPDELESNRLGAVLSVTQRNFQWDDVLAHNGGRVVEVLSEHMCQALVQGYILTGRHALFPSYEAFLPIVSSMMVQYAKFSKTALETKWRGDCGALNYLMSSGWEGQEHNGQSHQSPGMIGDVLNMKSSIVRVYLPSDANTLLCTMAHCLRSKNFINLVVASKRPMFTFLSIEEATLHCVAGASVWHRYSSSDVDTDVVLACCGAEVTFETLVASKMLRERGIKVRVVNVNDLMVLGSADRHPHALDKHAFDTLFTSTAPVVMNFHGYPSVVKSLLFDRDLSTSRFHVAGFSEEGTTTTPFKMLTLNKTSRYDICIAVYKMLKSNHPLYTSTHTLVTDMQHKIVKHNDYILENGRDPDGLYDISLIN